MAELRTSGSLVFGNPMGKTLEDLERFCKEARELGLDGKTEIMPIRQGLLGPINSWYFPVPVIPKPKEEAEPYEVDPVILPTRAAAEKVVDEVAQLIEVFKFASVADFYNLCGISTTLKDTTWGWDNFTGGEIKKVQGGYELEVPEPKSIADISTGG